MLVVIQSIVGFILAIGVLITVHEFGHFWVARKLGVKVLRFSIGFGKPLLHWYDKLGTEYVISALPLGGYVKMLDGREGPVATSDRHMAFDQKSPLSKMAIIAAGPLFNWGFAILAYWLIFVIGISTPIPMLGQVSKGTVAEVAGLKRGDEIVAVNQQATASWDEIAMAVYSHLGNSTPLYIQVKTESGNLSEHAADLTDITIGNSGMDVLQSIGLEPFDPIAPIVGDVMEGLPAQESGIEVGDRILAANNTAIHSRTELSEYLRQRPGQSVNLTIQRQNESLTISVTPVKKLLEGGMEAGFIGIQYAQQPWPKELLRLHRTSPGTAFLKAVERTRDYTLLTVQFIGKMLTGKASTRHISGPITIAKHAGQSFVSGLEYFLGFLAMVSISLAVLNALPVPILDGGQFMYALYELIVGQPVSEKAMGIGFRFGILFLLSIMVIAIYNDLSHLV